MKVGTGGGEVSVKVKGVALEEYQVERKKQDNVETYTCYIEAKNGEEYMVDIADFPVVKQGYFVSDVYVDGRHADGSGHCASRYSWKREQQSNAIIYEGFSKDRSNGKTITRAFTFNKMQTTNDVSASKPSPQELEELCTIRVEIIQTFRVGKLRHSTTKKGEPREDENDGDLPALPVISEDCKPASYGLSTGLGTTKVEKRTLICDCEMVDNPKPNKIIVVFKYLPHQWLVAKGLKKPQHHEGSDTDEDEDFAIDTKRTERSAELLARRRAREEGSSLTGRNVRVKTEVQVKYESIMKTEEKVKVEGQDGTKKADCLDLTGDGDFKLPSRKVGETIVIEDD